MKVSDLRALSGKWEVKIAHIYVDHGELVLILKIVEGELAGERLEVRLK